jgi:hypothetical protein
MLLCPFLLCSPCTGCHACVQIRSVLRKIRRRLLQGSDAELLVSFLIQSFIYACDGSLFETESSDLG